MAATIQFADTVQAQFIADMPQLAGNGHRVDVDGSQVTLSAAALGALAELDEENDGHYDGEFIWIGGTEYAVWLPVTETPCETCGTSLDENGFCPRCEA